MKISVLHPTGNRNVRAVITALLEAGMLAEFYTTLAVNPTAPWLQLLPGKLRAEWLRRTFPVPASQVWTHPLREMARMVLPRVGLSRHIRHEQGWASMDAVYQDFDQTAARRMGRRAGRQQLGAVYAYEDGALATFRQAKSLGLKCIYDLPIAYWETGRQLLLEEADRLPAWAATLGGGIHDSTAKLERKSQELELADVVVGPGKFVTDSLPAWARGKQLISAPFGSPASSAGAVAAGPRKPGAAQPLRVLFVGAMGQRKGLGDLFEAVRLLNRPDLELVVMGTPLVPLDFYYHQLPSFRYEPGRPHDQVLALMRSCDVFCLPSIVEGRALVMQEAMSQGLPLIITPNTGGPDLIHEGCTGFLVPIRSPQVIADRLAWFLDNRAALPQMSRLAQEHAARYTWESYGSHIVGSLTKFLAC